MAKRKGKKSGSTIPTNPDAVIMRVLRESYQENMESLKYFTEKIRHMNEISRAIRELLKELREFRRNLITSARELRLDLCSSGDDVLVELIEKHTHPHEVDDFGYELCIPDRIPPAEVQDLDALDTVIDRWENELATIGNDAQLANVDLQNMVQKNQQVMQMLSILSKSLHDTAMAVIRNIGT